MADEVVKTPEVTATVEAPKAATEKKSTTRGRKKGPTAKSATVKKAETKAVEKKPGRKPAAKKTADKKPKTATTATKKAAAPQYNFTKTVFEFDKKQFTEETINKKVLEYLVKHPYIHAEKIETFVNLEEKKVYFTVDGFGNTDFSVDL